MAYALFALLLALIFSPYILSLIIAYIVTSTSIKNPKRKPPPPKAKGAWPIIGHIHRKLDHTNLGAMADEYGPIFTVQLGLTPALVVSSWEVAKEIFTEHDLAVSSRPNFIATSYFGYNNAMFSFAPYGPYWRELRKVSTIHLLSNAKLDLLKHVREFEIRESIKDLYKEWMQLGEPQSGKILVEMKQWFLNMAFNIIVKMIAGKRYFGSSADSEEAKRCQTALRKFFDILGAFLVADSFPSLRWLDLGGHEKMMKKESRELDAIVQGWLNEHRYKRTKLGHKEKVDQDFMDVLLNILDGEELHGYDSDTINKATSVNMILGGSDTTTVTITWALSLLLNNPQSLKKAQDELDKHVGRHRQVQEYDIPNLAYLQAIVKETLRLYPAAPLSGPRQFDKDCVINGYHVSKGSRLILNLHKLQRDSRIWHHPLAFQPERFLTTHKNIDIKGRSYEFLPFGSGRRMCPGTALALGVVQLALASFLHAFELSTPSGAPVDMEESSGLTVIKVKPLNVLLSPRLSAHLYV